MSEEKPTITWEAHLIVVSAMAREIERARKMGYITSVEWVFAQNEFQHELDRLMSVDIHSCARCGNDHPGLTFKRFVGKPMASDCDDGRLVDGTKAPSEYDYWAICPNTGDPVIMAIVENGEVQS